MAEVYILHFERPVWGHAMHYCGYTKFTSQQRLQKHANGTGSKLCRYANVQGIDYRIVHIEKFETPRDARRREIKLKREGRLKRYCSICNANIQKKETH